MFSPHFVRMYRMDMLLWTFDYNGMSNVMPSRWTEKDEAVLRQLYTPGQAL